MTRDNALAETVNGYYKSELIYGPARSHRDEHLRLSCIRPAHRQRELPAIHVEEEHPILRPRLPNR